MRRERLFYLVLVSTLLISFQAAFAEDKEDKAESEVVYEKKTVIDFSDVLISGELMRPDGIYVKNRKKMQLDSLIELRSNFRPELIKSADDL